MRPVPQIPKSARRAADGDAGAEAVRAGAAANAGTNAAANATAANAAQSEEQRGMQDVQDATPTQPIAQHEAHAQYTAEEQDAVPTQPIAQHESQPEPQPDTALADSVPEPPEQPQSQAQAQLQQTAQSESSETSETSELTAQPAPSTQPDPSTEPDQSPSSSLHMYSSTVSDVGTVRSNNQDSSFAGEYLVAVCDGMGGHAGGDTASTIAVRSLAHIEQAHAEGDIARATHVMAASVLAAHDAIVGKAKRERKLAGMGTTVTAISLVSDHWIITHIGDSRAYLLRGGRLLRLTSDHSYVQHLIDTKRITEAEGRNHPQRNVVMRVLGDFDIDAHPDVAIRKAQAGDRLLLCSDGLYGVLGDATLKETLEHFADPQECAQHLVSMALRAGSTDNVTAVIADAVLSLQEPSNDHEPSHEQIPLVGGAASAGLLAIADILNAPVASAPPLTEGKSSPAQRAAALTQNEDDEQSAHAEQQRIVLPSTVRESNDERPEQDTGEIPVVTKSDGRRTADPNDPDVAKAIRQEQVEQRKNDRSRRSRHRIIAAVVAFLIVAAAAVSAWFAYSWTQRQYYLAPNNGKVAIWQGVPTNLFGIGLSHPVETTNLEVAQLPSEWQDRLDSGITVNSYSDAVEHAQLIENQLHDWQAQQKKDSASKGSGSADSRGSSGSQEGSKDNSGNASKDDSKSSDSKDPSAEESSASPSPSSSGTSPAGSSSSKSPSPTPAAFKAVGSSILISAYPHIAIAPSHSATPPVLASTAGGRC
ncbi:protein phosphatase 2C [Bifidobacterium gallicum DSM 20093 = LMG 11596]|nr:protein phosphatase 2C [Bifidobacterium gallicum DSM 20093 = LMG 11596]